MVEEPLIRIQRIGEDISMDEVMKAMTHCSDLELSRFKRGWETCEYNPSAKRAAYSGDDPGSCQHIARVCVGAKGAWHLCNKCAALPEFKRFRARSPLVRGQSCREPVAYIPEIDD